MPDVFMQFGLEQQFRFVSDDLSLQGAGDQPWISTLITSDASGHPGIFVVSKLLEMRTQYEFAEFCRVSGMISAI